LASGVEGDAGESESASAFYKKKWFLVAAVGAIVLTGVLVATSGDDEPSEGAERLPDFPLPPTPAPHAHAHGSTR
jgi:hypothetical protein